MVGQAGGGMIMHPDFVISEWARVRLKRLQSSNRARARKRGIENVAVPFYWRLVETGFMCRICGGKMDPELKGPDPLCISYEHDPALGSGGRHIPEHSFGAHLGCNVRKGNETDSTVAAKVNRVAGITGQKARRDRERAAGRHQEIQHGGFQTNRSGKYKKKIGKGAVRRDDKTK
jgi:hypothetical protein